MLSHWQSDRIRHVEFVLLLLFASFSFNLICFLMKNSLAILAALALASVASASTVLTLDGAALREDGGTYTDTANKISTSGYAHCSLTFVLDAPKFISAVQADPFQLTQITTVNFGSDSVGLAIKADNTYGTGLYGTWGGNNTLYAFWTDGRGATQTELSKLKAYFADHSDTTYTYAALTYEITGTTTSNTAESTGATVYLTLVDSEGNLTNLYGLNGGLKGSGLGDVTSFTYNTALVRYITVDNTVLDATAAAAANMNAIKDSIPEPATATLSLLALAGLAARRRRS